MRSIRNLPIAILAFGLLLAVNASSALAAPTVTTGIAIEVAGTAATLNGTVAAEKSHSTKYSFGYGTSPSINEFTGDTPVQTTTSSSPIAASAHITGLAPETTYYYAIAALDTVTNQIATGEVRSFKTTANNGIQFMAAEYPATVSGALGSETVFEAAGGIFKVQCKTRTLSGTLASANSSITLNPTFGSCSNSGWGSMTIKMNSCSFVTSAANNWGVYAGGLVISCTAEGDAIEFANPASGCNFKVGPSALSGTWAYYENTGPLTARSIAVGGWANYLKWTATTICKFAGIPASGQDGTIGPGLQPGNEGLTGTILKATNSKGAYTELYVAG